MERLVPAELIDRAARAYARTVVALDPVRLERWDSRGLTMAQLRLLYILHAEGSVPVGLLAERLGVRPSTITGLMNRLSRQRLIRRRTDPRDRRVVRVELTPSGREALEEITLAAKAYLAEVFAHMDPEEAERVTASFETFADAARATRARGAAANQPNQ